MKHIILNKTSLITAAILLPVTGLLLAAKSPRESGESQIERGKRLVTIGGCNDCHTPLKNGPKGPEPDLSRFLSGHPKDANYPPPPKLSGPWFAVTAGMTAWAGPWGISYAANLTPDKNTGMGIWTEDMFIQAMRTGQHFGVARPILPPMPWQNLAAQSEEDLKAIFAYLKSLPPIYNQVPDAEPPADSELHPSR